MPDAPESTATEFEKRFAELDAQTVAYIELVSEKQGIQALRAWVRYTGFSLDGKQRRTIEQRIDKARKNAARYVLALSKSE
jgi:hypothetical protein